MLPENHHTSYAIQLQLKQLNKLDGSSRLPCALNNSGWASLSTHEQVAGYLTSNSSHAFVAVSPIRAIKKRASTEQAGTLT